MNKSMKSIYKHPKYYEIAFSFINPKEQTDLFEKFVSKYSKIRVKRVLDLGCGPSLQLRELVKRGYITIGLDKSKEMLNYLKKQAEKEKLKIQTKMADMKNFSLKKKVDFAFIMMGTIGNFQSNKNMFDHLNSVASKLKRGCLYLIENACLNWREKILFKPEKWTIEKRGVKVKTTFSLRVKDVINQLLLEKLLIRVNDNGVRKTFEENEIVKLIFPQEFLEIVQRTNKFKFIGWFERNKVKRLKKANRNNIIVLRRL